MKNASLALMAFAALALSCAAGTSCGTTTGNPQVRLQFASYTASSLLDYLIAPAYASVSSLKLCFKRLRFKANSTGSAGTGDVDLQLGEVTIASAGTSLTTVEVAIGVYRRIEFDLEDQCASARSVQLQNGSGSFSTSDRMTIKFDGTFTADAAEETLVLGIQALVSQMDTVTADSQIKDRAEAAAGDF